MSLLMQVFELEILVYMRHVREPYTMHLNLQLKHLFFYVKTRDINNGEIIPIQSGLGDSNDSLNIEISNEGSWGNKLIQEADIVKNISEVVNVITLNSFVESNKIGCIDFINADIEGLERNMLKGAQNVLKHLASKLSICTYHLPDDPQILELIIGEANPKYRIIHLRHKLFASI